MLSAVLFSNESGKVTLRTSRNQEVHKIVVQLWFQGTGWHWWWQHFNHALCFSHLKYHSPMIVAANLLASYIIYKYFFVVVKKLHWWTFLTSRRLHSTSLERLEISRPFGTVCQIKELHRCAARHSVVSIIAGKGTIPIPIPVSTVGVCFFGLILRRPLWHFFFPFFKPPRFCLADVLAQLVPSYHEKSGEVGWSF